jgi:acyl-CoA thioester hydrolase
MVGAGMDMVVAEALVCYLGPLRFDDEFDVVATVARLGDTSVTTELVVDHDGMAVAEGELRHVLVAAPGGKTAPIPEPIRAGLERYLAASN